MAGDAYALFLDFDGTLVDIAPKPDAVIVPDGLAGTLARLRDKLGGALAIVTGRPIATIDAFLAPERFDVAGLHGVERRRNGAVTGAAPEDHPDLRRVVGVLARESAPLEGVLIEDKGASVALHWRLARPADAQAASALIESLAAELGPRYRLQAGKAVAEILPAGATKGQAIRAFLNESSYAGRRPVFFGDDLTDEKAFADVHALGGVSVRVGPGPTEARRRVESPLAVRAALIAWAADTARLDPEALSPA